MNRQTNTGRRLLTLALALAALATWAPRDAAAQVSLEGRVGAAIPVGELTDEAGPNQTVGLGVAGAAMYTFRPNFSIYGELSSQWFSCDGCDTNANSWGVNAGLKYGLMERGNLYPWIRAGVAFQRLSIGDAGGEWGVGLDAGIGVDWGLTDQFYLAPAVRFDIYGAGGVTVSYFTVDVGVHWHLYE